MKRIGMMLAGLSLALISQAQGISFEHGSWDEVRAKATKEHKLVYVDVYTTWCGPCKIMASTVFPQDAAGKKYNEAFINYKIDAEKGEGIAFAKQYQVEGYPTNLYIDPQSGEAIYRVMGATDLEDFIHRADLALEEHKDPMKWADYEQKFGKGDRDRSFLEAYMTKAKRLDKNNDKALDAYVEKYVPAKPDKTTLAFLADHTLTLDNNAVAVLFAHKDELQALHPEEQQYFEDLTQMLPYTTLQKAIANKDAQLLQRMEQRMTTYKIPMESVSGFHYYTKEFYRKTGDEVKAWEAMQAEAKYLDGLTEAQYSKEDDRMMTDIRTSLIRQMQAMKVPESQFESSISATLESHPEMKHPAKTNAAQLLNESAWYVVENKRGDKAALKAAQQWSAKSMDMVGDSESWCQMADTYASLLYLDGSRKEAIAKEEEAISKAEARQMQGIEELKANLEKMKSGTL